MDTFKIRVVQTDGDKFNNTVIDDITLSIPDTDANTRQIHIGITDSDNVLSIGATKTTISQDLYIGGSLYDSDSNVYLKGDGCVTLETLFNYTGITSVDDVGIVLSHKPTIFDPIIQKELVISDISSSTLSSFNIGFSDSTTTYMNTGDIILNTNDKPLHVGSYSYTDTTNESPYVSFGSNSTKVYGDLQIMGNILDINGDILNDSEYNIENGSILNKHIANNTLTLHKVEKVSGGGDHFVSSLNPQIFAPRIGGGITFSPGSYIGDNGGISLGTTHLFDNAVTYAKIADNSIDRTKIINYSITSSELANNCIKREHLSDLAVTTNKLDIDSVTTSKVLRESITNDKLSINSVTTPKIMDRNITPDKVSDVTGTTSTFVLQDSPQIKSRLEIVHDGEVYTPSLFSIKEGNETVMEVKPKGDATISGKLKGKHIPGNVFSSSLLQSDGVRINVLNNIDNLSNVILKSYNPENFADGELYVDSDININGDIRINDYTIVTFDHEIVNCSIKDSISINRSNDYIGSQDTPLFEINENGDTVFTVRPSGDTMIAGKLVGTRVPGSIIETIIIDSNNISNILLSDSVSVVEFLKQYPHQTDVRGELYVDSDINIQGDIRINDYTIVTFDHEIVNCSIKDSISINRSNDYIGSQDTSLFEINDNGDTVFTVRPSGDTMIAGKLVGTRVPGSIIESIIIDSNNDSNNDSNILLSDSVSVVEFLKQYPHQTDIKGELYVDSDINIHGNLSIKNRNVFDSTGRLVNCTIGSIGDIDSDIANNIKFASDYWFMSDSDFNKRMRFDRDSDTTFQSPSDINIIPGIDSKLNVEGNIECVNLLQTSDERIKTDKKTISHALDSLCKLRPQTYQKWPSIECKDNIESYSKYEAGLIAQEMYSDVPELRHLISPPDSDTLAKVNYIGLIPYTVSAIQEMVGIIAELREEIALLKKCKNT